MSLGYRAPLVTWTLRLIPVSIIAVAMAVVGLYLPTTIKGPALPLVGYVWVASSSVILWSALAFPVHRYNYAVAALLGVLSPLMGAFLVCPPVSHIYILYYWYVVFPVGLVTGLLVKLVLRMQLLSA